MILNIFYILFFILYFPVLLLRGKWHDGFGCRFGFIPKGLVDLMSGKKNIWIHAVSVGEVSLVEGIIKSLNDAYPGHQIVLSVTTRTGYEFAASKYAARVILLWSPLDLTWVVRHFVKVIHPVIYVAAETELWPNLFKALESRHIPIVLVNGRISDEAFPRYQRAAFLLRKTMASIRLVCAQSELDARRFKALGARAEGVCVVGNIKFDLNLPALTDAGAVKHELGFSPLETVWVSASTHPGEEEIVLDAFKTLKIRYKGLRLVLVPRHPERAPQVAKFVRKCGFLPVLLSGRKPGMLGVDEILVTDAVGYLMKLYQAADIVFIGKSLGVPKRGGQNPVEAASLGKPVIVGPFMENFRDVVRLLKEGDGIIEIADQEGLKDAVEDLLMNPSKGFSCGARAKGVVDKNRGALERTVALIRRVA